MDNQAATDRQGWPRRLPSTPQISFGRASLTAFKNKIDTRERIGPKQIPKLMSRALPKPAMDHSTDRSPLGAAPFSAPAQPARRPDLQPPSPSSHLRPRSDQRRPPFQAGYSHTGPPGPDWPLWAHLVAAAILAVFDLSHWLVLWNPDFPGTLFNLVFPFPSNHQLHALAAGLEMACTIACVVWRGQTLPGLLLMSLVLSVLWCHWALSLHRHQVPCGCLGYLGLLLGLPLWAIVAALRRLSPTAIVRPARSE